MISRSIVWLRRDLRLGDNTAIFQAARESGCICCAFVLNPQLLASPRMGAPLVASFFCALAALRAELRALNSDLILLRGEFTDELLVLARRVRAEAVFFAEDYEPEAIRRDGAVARALQESGLLVRTVQDHVYFGAGEIARPDGSSYRVFTPYKRRWIERRAELPRQPVPSRAALARKLLTGDQIGESEGIPAPELFGFSGSPVYARVSERIGNELLAAFTGEGGAIERYAKDRNNPALRGTSRLSAHLRAGTVGIRSCIEGAYDRRAACRDAVRGDIDAWISELVWRDFYQMILKQFPRVVDAPFLEAADRIAWRDAPRDFAAWCVGCTGYPLIDAAMRELNVTGWMHNRLRMLVASFLTKHLLIDWRLGERYFEQHLADAELASNNGGWQWAASVGTDAVPYFRIFNPVEQSRRFDPDGEYIRSFVPELARLAAPAIHQPSNVAGYPRPIVDHRAARARALGAYAAAFRRRGT
ncbi:MAG: deoxyribodipyrimidine photo-lyase [Candidatus Baltobacteraceae bacterium]